MPNIDAYLSNIMSPVYGEEVRGSIHDAINSEVFGRGIDTAGNFHWHATVDGHHVYMAQNNGQYGYYYNFMCRADQCIKGGIVTYSRL